MIRDWTTSEKIDNLTERAELFFVRLIMKADDHGCYHANPKLLKAALFPLKDYSEKEIEILLKELSVNGIVDVYEAEGRWYLKIRDFGQRLRTMKSSFPQPDDIGRQLADKRPQIADKRPPEEKRREVEEEEEEKRKDRAWYDSQFDEIFLEQLRMNHKGKDLQQAMNESWTFLTADQIRLKNSDRGNCRQLLAKWLSNMKTGVKTERKKLL